MAAAAASLKMLSKSMEHTENTKKNKSKKAKLSPLETLQVYKDFKDFRKYVYRAIDKMPKWIKHSEGANCMQSIKVCVRCLSVIGRTYDREVKLHYIDAFLTEWDVVSDSIEFFFEVHGIMYNKMIIVKIHE